MNLGPNDLVYARNESDDTVDVVGDKFAPHARRVMTFAWMMNHFGDPRSIRDNYQVIRMPNGQTMGVAPRQVEVQRVNRMWNVGVGDGMRNWNDIPKLDFYTMDDERIYTAFDDPEGMYSTESSRSVHDEEAQREKILKLERQVEQLLAVSGLDHDALPSDDADIPIDESEAATDTTSPWAGSEPLNPAIDDEAALRAFGT